MTQNVTIEFAVTDTGIGIPKEKLATIFDNQQASSGTSRIYGGTGLGLAIVKQLVEPQGGVINVVKVGKGTTFSFRLNFQKTTAEAELEILELDKGSKTSKF
jgi:signal transduction histidine kinase